jgi:hypothetical protein
VSSYLTFLTQALLPSTKERLLNRPSLMVGEGQWSNHRHATRISHTLGLSPSMSGRLLKHQSLTAGADKPPRSSILAVLIYNPTKLCRDIRTLRRNHTGRLGRVRITLCVVAGSLPARDPRSIAIYERDEAKPEGWGGYISTNYAYPNSVTTNHVPSSIAIYERDTADTPKPDGWGG